MNLLIKRLDPRAILPKYQTPGAAAFDLAIIESTSIAPGEICRLRTGLVFMIPQGYYLQIASRSSTAPKRGLAMANGIGIIDSDYCGENDEVFLCFQNITQEPVHVETGDRLAQGILLPAPQCQIQETTQAGGTDRGGFGSTGR